ncbi:amidase [Rhizobium sp. ARZ01]|uniref:amidase n=1 Tax=Rhizobium sp. ARZ01 TaxID=2769313 RepID=UPI00177E4A67|nr:amidase [Rhizobium sp. ARZ01]MBD9374624.1 amidase [Rhizobium sp. ARZ01]
MSQNPIRTRLEKILSRLEERKDTERTYVKLYPQTARAEADAADARLREGRTIGPLDGRIVSIKDLFDVAGEPTLAGSVIRRSNPPATADAPIVRRLREAGAVIIGKTHMTEFAFTAVGLNPHYPVPGNATDENLVPGGSSSGAAVSAAEGTCDIAIGSDTGGSIRIPAALNGLVGFKPTASRIPLDGAFPLAPSLDSVGPLADSVAACALADAIMAGEKPEPLAARSLKALKVGAPRGRLFEDMEPEIAAAFESNLARLADAGAELTNCSIDDLLEALAEATRIGSIAGIEASRIHADWLDDDHAPVDFRVTTTLRRRRLVSDADLAALLETRNGLAQAMDARLAPFDVLALPTSPIFAASIASVSSDEETYRHVEDLLLRNNQVGNQFDLTAITLPMPGLAHPAGFMLFGRNGTDKMLLQIAASVEALMR